MSTMILLLIERGWMAWLYGPETQKNPHTHTHTKDETAAAGAAAVPTAGSDKTEISFCSRCGRRNDAAISLTHRNTGGNAS